MGSTTGAAQLGTSNGAGVLPPASRAGSRSGGDQVGETVKCWPPPIDESPGDETRVGNSTTPDNNFASVTVGGRENRLTLPAWTVHKSALDPVWWTSSERWIRCPTMADEAEAPAAPAASLTTTRPAPCGWCWTKARRSAPRPATSGLTESSLRNWVEQAPRGSDEGQDRADDRRARGAGAAAEGKPRSSARSATS